MSESPQKFVPQNRKSVWSSNLITLAFLAIFILLCFGIEYLLKPTFTPGGLMITGVIMALIPAFLWLAFFYRQDRLEPEPKGMVLEIFILGGLLAAAIGIPLLNDVFHISTWLFSGFWVTLLGAILVIGFSQEFLKYAAVRFGIYENDEFNEHSDGIVYATAAGLGFATALNISFIVSSGGVNLGMGAVRIVLTALAQASFAGITGYFLGKDKLDKKPAWWVPVGITISAVVNGLFNYVWGVLKHTGITISGGLLGTWGGLLLAILISVIVTIVLSWLIERDVQEALKLQEA